MITIVEQDASWCRVLKNEEHWNIIFDILSYPDKTKDRYSYKVEDVIRSFFDRRGGKFGTGLLPYVEQKLIEKNINYTLTKTAFNKHMKIRTESNLNVNKFIQYDDIELEKYQKKILSIINENKRGCIQSPTGSGKSLLIASIVKKLNIPTTLIIVPTLSIAKGVRKEVNNALNIPVGMLSGTEKTIEKVTIGLYQTVRSLNIKEINDDIELIIIDESHGAKCKSILNILSNLPDVWYRYGFSGTFVPQTQKKEWFAVTSQLGPILIKIDDEEASSKITNVKVIMCKFTTTSTKYNFQDIYRYDVLLNENRCELLLEMVEYGLKKCSNCLLLVDEYEQAKLIQKIAKTIYLKNKHMIPKIAWSGLKQKELDTLQEDLNSSKLRFCIATPVWKIGTNIRELECLVLGSARKSLIDTEQKIGRARRKTDTKKHALILDVYDKVIGNNKFEEFSKIRMNFYKEKNWLRRII